jgi:outer membrane protein assembly factor BamB
MLSMPSLEFVLGVPPRSTGSRALLSCRSAALRDATRPQDSHTSVDLFGVARRAIVAAWLISCTPFLMVTDGVRADEADKPATQGESAPAGPPQLKLINGGGQLVAAEDADEEPTEAIGSEANDGSDPASDADPESANPSDASSDADAPAENGTPKDATDPVDGNSDGQKERRPSRDAIDARAPRDRELDATWRAGSLAVQRQQWAQAVELLQRVLDSPIDSVTPGPGGQWKSVRESAQQKLSQLPEQIRAEYVQKYEGLAEQLLQKAIRSHDQRLLVEVASRFPQTPSGRQAAQRIAGWHFDRREFGLAARRYAELLQTGGLDAGDVSALMQAAFAARAAMPALVDTFLTPLRQSTPTPLLTLGGKAQPLEKWWQELPIPESTKIPVLSDWWMPYGSAARVGLSADVDPWLVPRWQQHTSQVESVQQQVRWLLDDLRDAGVTAIPAAQPLVVREMVVYRDLRGVRAVHAETGESLWESAPGLSPEQILAGLPPSELPPAEAWRFRNNARQQVQHFDGESAQSQPLSNLLFRDGTTGQLSSDGQRVFALEDVAVLTRNDAGYQWDGEEEPTDPYGADWSSNRLSAYELTTGRLLWTVGGPQVGEPQHASPLAGCFFLSAPVVDGDELYTVASQGDQILLWALSPETGVPLWSQLLAYSDTKIQLDLARRRIAAPVAVGQGVIVCPTTVGWVVAVDRLRHTVLWARRYLPRQAAAEFEEAREMLTTLGLEDHWLPGSPIITGSSILFAPPEGQKLYCWSLFDGSVVWQQPRGDDLLVLGTTGRLLLTLGPKRVLARDMQSGRTMWTSSWTGTVRPAGRGVLSERHLLLPMSNGELLQFDLATGKHITVKPPSGTVRSLGNLVLASQRLISLSPDRCQMLSSAEQLTASVAARLQKAPGDIDARLLQVELLRSRDDLLAALRALQEMPPAADWKPEQYQRHQQHLWEVLTELSRQSAESAPPYLKQLNAMVRTPQQRLELTKLGTQLLLELKQPQTAIDSLFELEPFVQPELLFHDPENPDVAVSSPLWLRGQLHRVAEVGGPAAFSHLHEVARKRIFKSISDDPLAMTRASRYLDVDPNSILLSASLVTTYTQLNDLGRAEAEAWRWIDQSESWTVAPESKRKLAFDAVDLVNRAWALRGLVEPTQRLVADTLRRWPQPTPHSGNIDHWLDQPVDALTTLQPRIEDWDNATIQAEQLMMAHSPQVLPVKMPLNGLSAWAAQIEPHEQRLTLQNRRTGQWDWLAPLKGQPDLVNDEGIGVWPVGHRLLVLHQGVLQMLSPLDRKRLWSRALEAPSHGHPVEDQGEFVPPPLASVPEAGEESILLTSANQQGSVVAVQPRYLAVRAPRKLQLLDPRDGSLLWEHQRWLPSYRTVAATDYLYVHDHLTEQAFAVSVIDSRRTAVPLLNKLLSAAVATVGNDLVVLDRSPGFRLFGLATGRIIVKRVQPLTSQEQWKLDFRADALVGTLDADTGVVVEPVAAGPKSDRRLWLIDWHTGQKQALQPVQLNPDGNLDHGTYVLTDGPRILMVANAPSNGGYHYGDSLPGVPAHGVLAQWDRATGQLQWRQQVSDQNLVVSRHDISPVLLFLSRSWQEHGNTPYSTLNLKLLSKSTGKVLYDFEGPTGLGGFHGVSVNESQRVIELHSYNLRLRLQAVSTPVAPSTTAPSGPADATSVAPVNRAP